MKYVLPFIAASIVLAVILFISQPISTPPLTNNPEQTSQPITNQTSTNKPAINKPTNTPVNLTTQECLINPTTADFSQCIIPQNLLGFNFDGITNLKLLSQFELVKTIGNGFSIDAEKIKTGQLEAGFNVYNIGKADQGDIYIFDAFNTAFPVSQYKYSINHSIYKIFLRLGSAQQEDWVKHDETISIYSNFDLRHETFTVSTLKTLKDSTASLPNCPEINNNTLVFRGKNYSNTQPPCLRTDSNLREDQEIVTISDTELETCIRKEAGLNNNKPIHQFHLNDISKLNCNSPKIKDISALSKFPNILGLNLNLKNITNLQAIERVSTLQALSLKNGNNINLNILSNLTQLQYLEIESSSITNLDTIGYFRDLHTLYLDKVDLKNTDFLQNAGPIEYLSFASNNLTSFKYYPSLNLKYLDLSDNQLTSITEFNQYLNLTNLRIQKNNISNIDELFELQYLEAIDANNNQITRPAITQSNKNALSILTLNGNPIHCDLPELLEMYFINHDCRTF